MEALQRRQPGPEKVLQADSHSGRRDCGQYLCPGERQLGTSAPEARGPEQSRAKAETKLSVQDLESQGQGGKVEARAHCKPRSSGAILGVGDLLPTPSLLHWDCGHHDWGGWSTSTTPPTLPLPSWAWCLWVQKEALGTPLPARDLRPSRCILSPDYRDTHRYSQVWTFVPDVQGCVQWCPYAEWLLNHSPVGALRFGPIVSLLSLFLRPPPWPTGLLTAPRL